LRLFYCCCLCVSDSDFYYPSRRQPFCDGQDLDHHGEYPFDLRGLKQKFAITGIYTYILLNTPYWDAHGISVEKESRKFRLSFSSKFLTVLKFNTKENRNFHCSNSLVQNFSVAAYVIVVF
jgi:hypothetical protein